MTWICSLLARFAASNLHAQFAPGAGSGRPIVLPAAGMAPASRAPVGDMARRRAFTREPRGAVFA